MGRIDFNKEGVFFNEFHGKGGKGETGQIKKGSSFGRSVKVEVPVKSGNTTTTKVYNLDKGSLVKFLNAQKGTRVKFLTNIFGRRASSKQLRHVFNKFIANHQVRKDGIPLIKTTAAVKALSDFVRKEEKPAIKEPLTLIKQYLNTLTKNGPESKIPTDMKNHIAVLFAQEGLNLKEEINEAIQWTYIDAKYETGLNAFPQDAKDIEAQAGSILTKLREENKLS